MMPTNMKGAYNRLFFLYTFDISFYIYKLGKFEGVFSMDVYEQYNLANNEYQKILSECSGIVNGSVLYDESFQTRLTNAWIVLQQATYDLECLEYDFEIEDNELEM